MTNQESQNSTSDHGRQDESEHGVRCDFCGEVVSSVRRVALDNDYDRLRKPHKVLFACPPCSERKENERLGLERGSARA